MKIKRERKKLQKRLEKECMDLWQQVVKQRAGNKCEFNDVVGKTPPFYLCAHHIYTKKAHPVLKYNPFNGVCLDQYEHTKVHTQGSEKLMTYLIGKRGQQWADDLVEKIRDNPSHQYTVEILDGIRLGLLSMLKS